MSQLQREHLAGPARHIAATLRRSPAAAGRWTVGGGSRVLLVRGHVLSRWPPDSLVSEALTPRLFLFWNAEAAAVRCRHAVSSALPTVARLAKVVEGCLTCFCLSSRGCLSPLANDSREEKGKSRRETRLSSGFFHSLPFPISKVPAHLDQWAGPWVIYSPLLRYGEDCIPFLVCSYSSIVLQCDCHLFFRLVGYLGYLFNFLMGSHGVASG